MKEKLNARALATVGLVALCGFLVVRLIVATAHVGAGAHSLPLAAVRPAPARSGGAGDGMGAYDPRLHLDELARLSRRPLPRLDRDPFQFEPTPEQVQARNAAEAKANQPPAPPPLPPVPLKAVGFDQDDHGRYSACLVDDQEETFVVHEGEEFDKRFRVLRITPAMVEIQDETYHQTVQLPFPP
jgi:hypothetical protein